MIDPAAPRTPPPLGTRPRLTAAEIARAVAAGQGRFVLLLGPESDVGRLAAARRPRLARAALADWKRLIGPERIRIHLVTHLTRPGEPRSTAHAARMLGLAEAAGVGAVLSNAARYATEDQAVTADLLDAARGLTSLVGPGTASDVPPGLDPGASPAERGSWVRPAAPHLQPNGQGWLKDPRACGPSPPRSPPPRAPAPARPASSPTPPRSPSAAAWTPPPTSASAPPWSPRPT
ncbi:hypothetical protein NBM05_11535 [Rothia sp. AR01]|uniref:Uncharacterized protein n=1 Tax=Rothia santali TaxID=2949643 RepID=A0A9X2HJ24_9MICC|nr:hypothetical protein [Rothia santali]MCP3426616.1 hypothetical protein [Rothia santali]